MLADFPHELLPELGEATLTLDREAALEIFSRIAHQDPEVAAGLKGFVDNFQRAVFRNLLGIVNHDGGVYQKDLGEKTEELAKAMEIFDPDKTWTKAQ